MTRERSAHQRSPATFWVGFILGGIIAAVAVFLMGAQKGRPMLEESLAKMEEYEGNVEDTVAMVQEKSDTLIEKVTAVTDTIVERSDALAAQLDTALTSIEEVQKKSFTKAGKRLTS